MGLTGVPDMSSTSVCVACRASAIFALRLSVVMPDSSTIVLQSPCWRTIRKIS